MNFEQPPKKETTVQQPTQRPSSAKNWKLKKSQTAIYPHIERKSVLITSNEDNKDKEKEKEEEKLPEFTPPQNKTKSFKLNNIKAMFMPDFLFKNQDHKENNKTAKRFPMNNMKLDLKRIHPNGPAHPLEKAESNQTIGLPPLDLVSPSLQPDQRLESGDRSVSTKSMRHSKSIFNYFFKQKGDSGKDSDEEEEDQNDDLNIELEHVHIKFPLLIINPYGRFKYMWDFFMILLLLYFCYVLPIRLCFRRAPKMFETNRSTDFSDEWFVFDILCDIILFVDIILNFFSAYENDAGLIIFSKRKIMKRYLTHWFIVDLISTFPINSHIYRLPHIELEDYKFNFTNYKVWRVTRFIKLIRIIKLNVSIERLFSLMTLNIDKINIIKFVSFISVFIHITACLWNALAELQVDMGWQKVDELEDESVFDRYISSLYFGLTVLLTIGFGNIHPSTFPERLVAILWMFFGIIVYTYIISSLTSSFSKLNQTQSVQEEKDLFFREWNKMFKLPYETLDMILNTIGLKNQSQSTQKMQALNQASTTLADLSKSLYSEIYNNFFQDVLEKVIFFRNKPKQFLIKLMPLLKPTNFNQGDYIYKERDPAMEVFFVVKGRVISKCQDRLNKARAQIFVEGSFFGEIDIFMKRNRTVSARAENQCELWKIDKEDFLDILNQFPPIREEVEELVRIKEAYRRPMSLKKANSMNENSKDVVNDFEELEFHEENGIFGALTGKMIKKIQKGKYHSSADNRNTYESLDFEPDLPSPESLNAGRSILSEAEWKNFESTMTQRLIRKKNNLSEKSMSDEFNLSAAGSLQKQFKYKNTGIKRKLLKRKEDREYLRKSILARNARPSGTWETNFLAKQNLIQELQEKNYKITQTAEIDDVINGQEELEKARLTIIKKADEAETNIEKMIIDAETMLSALDQFEDGLEQMVDITNLKQIEPIEVDFDI